MRRIVMGALMVGVALLGACGDETKKVTNVISCKPALWNSAAPVAPPCSVALNFRVADTNAVFAGGQLEWKGSMQYDPLTRLAYKDAAWTGPYPKMYDDGAWDDLTPANRGHEPSGEAKADGTFGVTIFVYPPATGTETFEYGLNDSTYANGWLWPAGPNGTLAVPSTATGQIDAPNFALPVFGAVNVMLTINTGALDATFPLPVGVTAVQVKGSGWAWTDVVILDDGLNGDATAGDGIYTFVLSNYIGVGKPLPHTGLFASGATPEFVFDFVAPDPVNTEYKVGGAAATAGVSAFTGPTGTVGPWTTATISLQTNNNTYITIP
jgi:hypothetical protein